MVTELREGQAELRVYRSKPVSLFGQGTWGIGQLELRQKIVLPIFTNKELLLLL